MIVDLDHDVHERQLAFRRSLTTTKPRPTRRPRRPGWRPPPLWTPSREIWTPQNAVALDQSLGQGNAAAAATCTMSTAAAVASGAIIVIAVGLFRASSTTNITLSGGSLTWTTDKFVVSGNIKIALCSAKAPSGLASATTLTATPVAAGSCDWIMGGGSFTGIDTTGTILTGSNSSSGTGTTHTSGSITATAGDLLCEASFQDGSGTATGSATAPALLLFTKTVAGQTETLVFTYKLGMSATDSIGGGFSASVTHVDAGASYLAAAGAAAKSLAFQSRTARNMLLRR